MSNPAREYLVVYDDDNTEPYTDDASMRLFIHALLGTEPPSKWDSVADALRGNKAEVAEVAHQVGGARAGIAAALGVTALSKLVDSQLGPMSFSRVENSMDILVPLMRGIISLPALRAKAAPNIAFVQASSDELADVTVADGRLRLGVVYCRHPGDSSLTIPMNDFHSYLLADKRAEFTRLVGALGAKSLQLVDSRQHSSSASERAGLDDPTNSAKAGAKADMQGSTESAFSINAMFESPTSHAPSVPTDLKWLELEPMWKAMVRGRTENWLSSFRVKFSYKSDFGVSAEVAAGFEGLGLSIGGNYQEQVSQELEYLVEFWPREAYTG